MYFFAVSSNPALIKSFSTWSWICSIVGGFVPQSFSKEASTEFATPAASDASPSPDACIAFKIACAILSSLYKTTRPSRFFMLLIIGKTSKM